MKVILAIAAAFQLASAYAAGNDELWEVSSQMNMPGIPAGMGAQKHQVCTEKGDAQKAMQSKGSEKCKMTDFKQSGNKVTMTMECPDGTATIENTYNAAHTEYNGLVKMKSKRGDMTMTMAGKKIGTCDAQVAKAEREQKTAAAKQQVMAMQAQSDAAVARGQSVEIANCQAAVDNMELQKLGMYARCDDPQLGGYCKTMLSTEHTKPVAAKCVASQAEYCKRYQSMDGFIKSNADKEGAKMCKVAYDPLFKGSCAHAVKTEAFSYLGSHCPDEGRVLAKQHCVGFSYTSKAKTKYSDFCRSYIASNGPDDLQENKPASASGKVDATKQAVQQGVSQGINKIKGLFGK